MDSINLGNRPNAYNNRGGMLLLRSYGENPDFEDFITNWDSSINGETRSRIFIGPNSDDDDRYKFFMVCAENKINALIERVRQFNDNFGRSEEFEDEAVAMAIRQHGLRKNESNSNATTYGGINCENDSRSTDDEDDEIERKIKRKRHQAPNCDHSTREGFDVDDLYFLNEAVAAAIEQKGLSSSSLGALN